MDAHSARALHQALTERKNGVLAPIELDDANLSGLTIVGGDFVQGHFRAAVFAHATLPGARFGKADLEHTSFLGTDLAGSDFSSARLCGADLEGAKVEGCVFAGADLRGAKLANWLGTPLSLAGAKIDDATIERSGLSDEGLRTLLELGAKLEKSELAPASSKSASSLSVPRHVEILSASEASIRESFVDQDIEEQPASLRTFLQLGALLAEGRTEDAAPPSARGRLPMFAADQLGGYKPPEVGSDFLGVRLSEEVGVGSVARSFRGTDADGVEVFVRVFDPTKYGASLQYPSFRRGLKSLNDLQGAGIAELRAVAADKTAYVVRYYPGGNLYDVVSARLSLDTGLTLFRDLARIVLRIHGEGRLLRSIKPTNVVLDGLDPMITEIDAVDLPTLSQWSGSVGGYGAYAAPEEILATGTHSPTADVFALGKVLEFILIGEEPLEALGGVSPLALRDDLPTALREIVTRATKPEPTDRYQFIDELLEDLAKVVAHNGATLSARQSVRPAVPSRLDPKPLSLGVPRSTAKIPTSRLSPPSSLAVAKRSSGPLAPRTYWLPRRLEVAAAGFGLIASLALFSGLFLRPGPYETFQTNAFYASLLLGFATWLLPRPETKIAVYRIVFGAALGYLLALYLPDAAAKVAYQRAMKSSTSEGRQFALVQLARTGFRSFPDADLRGTRYFKADLVNVSFQRTNLEGADFTGSVLLEADFSGANLANVNFRAADLREAQLSQAKSLDRTTCDRLTLLSAPYFCDSGRITKRD